jgi:hypothetical protein
MQPEDNAAGYEPDEIALAGRLYAALCEVDPEAMHGPLVIGNPDQYGPGDKTLVDGRFDLRLLARRLLKRPDESISDVP